MPVPSSPRGYFWYIPGYSENDRALDFGSYEILDGFIDDAILGRHPNNKVNIVYADGHGESMNANVFVDGGGSTDDIRDREGALRWYENPNGGTLRD